MPFFSYIGIIEVSYIKMSNDMSKYLIFLCIGMIDRKLPNFRYIGVIELLYIEISKLGMSKYRFFRYIGIIDQNLGLRHVELPKVSI